MSIDNDLPLPMNAAVELYSIETENADEQVTPNRITGVAKRRFNRDHDTSYCKATTIDNYNGYAFVLATESPYRDHWDGVCIKAIRRHPEVVTEYHDGADDAIELLVDYAIGEAVGRPDPDEMEERLERLLRMLE